MTDVSQPPENKELEPLERDEAPAGGTVEDICPIYSDGATADIGGG